MCCSAGLKTNKHPQAPTKQQQKPQASFIFDPLHQAGLDMHRLATNFTFSRVYREQLREQQTECFLLQMAILSPEQGRAREQPISAYLVLQSHKHWLHLLYAQFKRRISVRLGRILVRIAWDTSAGPG